MNNKLERCFAFLLLFLVMSCKQDDVTPGFMPGGTMSATINGLSWAATSVTLNRPNSTTVQFSGERNSSTPQASGIGISLTGYSGAAIYNVDTSRKAYYVEAGSLYTSTTGQIEVSRDDDSFFKATFNFDAADSLNEKKTIAGSFIYRRK